jgi:hypothetical protein
VNQGVEGKIDPTPPDRVGHGVGGYSMQPADERAIGAIQAKFLVDLDKHVLGAVLGRGNTSERAIGNLQNHLVMALDQLPESVRVACEARRDELLIALGHRGRLA